MGFALRSQTMPVVDIPSWSDWRSIWSASEHSQWLNSAYCIAVEALDSTASSSSSSRLSSSSGLSSSSSVSPSSSSSSSAAYYDADLFSRSPIFFFGSEASGLSKDARSFLRMSKTTSVHIPVKRECESFNVASAAAMVLGEWARQQIHHHT